MADTSSSISVDIDDGQVLTSESVPMVNKSGMHAIYELFNEVVDYGFQVRTKKLNGLNLWNAIKSDFNTDSGNCKWILTVNIPNDASDEDIEEFFGKKVFLELFVKVNKDWRDKERELRGFGYEMQ